MVNRKIHHFKKFVKFVCKEGSLSPLEVSRKCIPKISYGC